MYSITKFIELRDRVFGETNQNGYTIFVKDVQYPFIIRLKLNHTKQTFARILLQNNNTSEVREQFGFLVTNGQDNDVSTQSGIDKFLKIFQNARNFRKCLICGGNFTAAESGLCFTCEISKNTDSKCIICLETRDTLGNLGGVLGCCNKIVHLSCLRKWEKNKNKNSHQCVHCRSTSFTFTSFNN